MSAKKQLQSILHIQETRRKHVLAYFDDLWKHCETKGVFKQAPEFKNYLMWIEHEASRTLHCSERELQEATRLTSQVVDRPASETL